MRRTRTVAIVCAGGILVFGGCSNSPAPVAAAPAKTVAESSPGGGKTVRYELKMDELKYVFGTLPPVARVHAGDIIETNTIDSDGHAAEAVGHKVLGFNALTGPFHIEEA